MTGSKVPDLHGPSLQALSTRVALATTAIVGVAYTVIAIAVAILVTNNLTAQIDANLARTLTHVPGQPPSPGNGFEPPPPERLGGSPVLVWTIHPDGTVSNISASNAVLPASCEHVSAPTTASISGVSFRIAGTPRGDDYVVVGQSMDNVSQTQTTLIAAEVGIGAALLLVVFLGAVAIGRRVAWPIEQARQRQMEFTADASHELRTPLSVIEAQTSLALAQERDDAWYRRAFERVDQETRRMRRLLEDMLWLARFDATKGQPNAEPVDVAVLARQTADRFAIVAEARHLALEVRAAGGPLVVNAPPEWLDRLLGVLLDNACKYSPDGGRVAVSVGGAGGRISLTVEDSGRGIPPEERSRIFDRFHRATDSASGSGLGLAIADAVVRATNGRWQIGSSAEGGASMSVSWPRAFPAAREPSAAGPMARTSSAARQR